MPIETFITPDKRLVTGSFPSSTLYNLVGTGANGGAFNSSELLSHFNSEWANLQVGGSWSAIQDDASSTNGYCVWQNVAGTYSRYISGGTSWTRNLDVFGFLKLDSDSRYFNLFFCVQDNSNYYRVAIDRGSTGTSTGIHTASLYKVIGGSESLVDSATFYFLWSPDGWTNFNLKIDYQSIVLYMGSGDDIIGEDKLSLTDSSLQFGSFGIGSQAGKIALKNITIRNSGVVDYRRLKLSYPLFILGQINQTSGTFGGPLDQLTPISSHYPDFKIPLELHVPPFDSNINVNRAFGWNKKNTSNIGLQAPISTRGELGILVFKNTIIDDASIFARYYYAATNNIGLVFDFQDRNNFKVIIHNSSNTYIYQYVAGVQYTLANIPGYGNYIYEITDWYYYITTEQIIIKRNNTEIYNSVPSVSWRDTVSEGLIGFYSDGGIHSLFNLEVFHTRRDFPDEGVVQSNAAESFKFGGSVAKQSISILGMNSLLGNDRYSTLDLTARIRKTFITKTPSFWGSGTWDDLQPGEEGPFDLLVGGSVKKQLLSNLTMTGQIKNKYISPSLFIAAAIKKMRVDELNIHGRLLGFFNNFIRNDQVDEGNWTNQSSQTFYVTSQLMNDPVVSYFLYSFSSDSQVNPSILWDGLPITVPAMSLQGLYYFKAEAYSSDDELLGSDTYIIGFDNINPIIDGPYIENIPVSENGDIVVKIQDIMWDTEPQQVDISVFKNGVLYKTESFIDPDHTARIFTITDNILNIGDQLDIQVTVYDRAGNTATDFAGYNYSGDEVGRIPTDYVVIQRYGYQISIWEGTLTEQELNSYYCPNMVTDLVRKWNCPVSEAGILFMPNTHDNCPYCQFPLVPGNFDLSKKVFETNFRPKVPFGSLNTEDDLSILKLAMNYAYLYQAESWLYRLEERESPYGQDIIEIGTFNDIVIDSDSRYRLHFEIQFSETTNFNDEVLIQSDTFSTPYDFELYAETQGTWQALIGGVKLSSGTLRFRMPRPLEVGVKYFYRWRAIRELNTLREYGTWSATSSHTIQKFTTPVEPWNGGYREHLLEDNFGFEGFISLSSTESYSNFSYGTVTHQETDSVSIFTPDPQNNVVLNFDLAEPTDLDEGNKVLVKIKFKSNTALTVVPVVRNLDLTTAVLSDLQKSYNIDTWQILTFDLSQSNLFSSDRKNQMGIVFNFPTPDPLTRVEVDYVAFLYKHPSYRKKYFYPHVVSNTMRCIFDKKADDPNIFKAEGSCLKLHTPGARWKGEWDSSVQYFANDGVLINTGTEYTRFIAITQPPIGINPVLANEWDESGTQPLTDPFPEGDGLYEGGSIYKNPNTTGYCKNTSCPDYTPLPSIDELTEMIFDLNATTISEDIIQYEAEATSGFLGCPNSRLNEDGTPECHNNLYKVPIPPARKICSRNEGFKNPDNWGNFDYKCSKFCMPVEYEGAPYGVTGRYDTAGVPYNDPNHPGYPGITFIPAVYGFEDFWTVDEDGVAHGHRVDTYNVFPPHHYYWSYDDPQTTCDGILRDSGEVCGAVLVPYSAAQLCPECGTPLVSLGTITDVMIANRCSNYTKSYQVIPRCTMAQEGIAQPASRVYCTESGDELVPFNRTPISTLITPIRQFTLSQMQTKRIADGLPKTYAYRGWDFLLNQPYTGYIGGSGGVFVEGDVWQGVTNFRKLYAKQSDVDNWVAKKDIATNLIDRTANELLTFNLKKESIYLDQYKRNVRYGDIESAIIKPGDFSDGYTIPLNDLELYAEQAELINSRLVLEQKTYSLGIKDAFVRSRLLFAPEPVGSLFWEFKFKINIISSAISNIASGTPEVLAQFGFGQKWGKIISINEKIYDYQDTEDTILSFQIMGWDVGGTKKGRVNFLASTTKPPYPTDSVTKLNTNDWNWTNGFNIELDCNLRIEFGQIIINLTYNDPSLGAKTNTFTISRDYYLPAPMAFAGFVDTSGIKAELYDIEVNPVSGDQEFIERNLVNIDSGTVFNDESDLFRLISIQDGDPFKIYFEWSETYYLLELDPKPTFDSRRGLPMRRIIGNGWMCLNKARGEVKGIRIPSGFMNQSSCKLYKHIFSEEEAKANQYRCPSCNYKLFIHRFDANLLSLIGTEKEAGKTNILPKLIYQMNKQELPGLHNSDYLMIDINKDGDQDYSELTTLLGTNFFDNSDDNKYWAYGLGDGWFERKAARLSTESGWVETQTNVIQHSENKVDNNSLYVPLDETPKQGKLITQSLLTNSDLWQYTWETGVFRIAAAKEIDLSLMSDLDKEQNLSDIRWSIFLPTAGHFWSAGEAYYGKDSESYNNQTDKRSLVEVELINSSNTVVGTFRYILSSTKLNYFDYVGFEYSQDNTIYDIYLRTPHKNELDQWIYYKQNVFADASQYLQDANINIPWNQIDKIRFNLVSEIIRLQDDMNIFYGFGVSRYYDYAYRPNFITTIWGEFIQGWTTLRDPGDSTRVLISPKAWNGVYYCRAIPYAIKLNPQWYNWWTKAVTGFGISHSEIDWNTHSMVQKFGIPPTKWMIRMGEPTASTDFYYGYDWNTVYNAEDKVVLPEGL